MVQLTCTLSDCASRAHNCRRSAVFRAGLCCTARLSKWLRTLSGEPGTTNLLMLVVTRLRIIPHAGARPQSARADKGCVLASHAHGSGACHPCRRPRQRRPSYGATISGRRELDQADRALVLGVSAGTIDRLLVETKIGASRQRLPGSGY